MFQSLLKIEKCLTLHVPFLYFMAANMIHAFLTKWHVGCENIIVGARDFLNLGRALITLPVISRFIYETRMYKQLCVDPERGQGLWTPCKITKIQGFLAILVRIP